MPLRTAGRLCPQAIFLDGATKNIRSGATASLLSSRNFLRSSKWFRSMKPISISPAPSDCTDHTRCCRQVASNHHAHDGAAVFRRARYDAARCESCVGPSQATRPRLGPCRQRTTIPRAAPRQKIPGIGEVTERALRASALKLSNRSPLFRRKSWKIFWSVGNGPVSQIARRRFLRIRYRCGAEIHLAQSHLCRGH